MSGGFDSFDVNGIRARLSAFIAEQGLSEVSVGPLNRFTVGFSWVTYGFRAAWRDQDGVGHRSLPFLIEQFGQLVLARAGPNVVRG